MLDLVLNSLMLFFRGNLFQDTPGVIARMALGGGIGAVALFGFSLIMPLWGAAMAGGAISGLLQPVLLKNLKYA